jgi:hypothetical protein
MFRGEQDRQIEFAGQQVDAHLVGEIEIDVEGCPGQDGAKPRDPIGDVVGGEIVLDADAHRLVEIAGALHRSAGFVPLVTQSSCMVEQPVSRRRWLGAGTAAGEQLLAEHGFKRVDAGRYRRLLQIQPVRCPVEAFRLHEIEKCLQQFDLHGWPPGNCCPAP